MSRSDLRYAFYVSGKATRLKSLLKLSAIRAYVADFAFVLSDNPLDAEIGPLCENNGIDCFFLDLSRHEGQKKNEVLSEFLLGKLISFRVDYCFVYGARILVGELLERYENRLINFHPSVLPAFKGTRAVDRALGEKSFLLGNSAHLIEREVDSGPVIMQNIMSKKDFTTIEALLDQQVLMQFQIIRWLRERRISVQNGCVTVAGANYSVREFIPQLDRQTLAELMVD